MHLHFLKSGFPFFFQQHAPIIFFPIFGGFSGGGGGGGGFIIILHKSMDTEIAVLLTCKYPTITTTKRQ